MRDTKRKQMLIDRAISSDDVSPCSVYIGQWDNKLVYRRFEGDTICRCEGLPVLYLLDEEDRVWVPNEEKSSLIFAEMCAYDFRKGKALFKQLQNLLKRNDGVPEFMQHEAKMILDFYHMGSEYKWASDENDVYMMLEQADRFNLRLDMVRDLYNKALSSELLYGLRLMERNGYTDEEEYWCTGGNTGMLPMHVAPSRFKSVLHDEVFVYWKVEMYDERNATSKLAELIAEDPFGDSVERLENTLELKLSDDFKKVSHEIMELASYVAGRPDLRFYLVSDSCEFSYLRRKQIRELFYEIGQLKNIFLPLEYWKLLLGE